MQKQEIEYYANRQGLNVFTTIVLIFLHIGVFRFDEQPEVADVDNAADRHGQPLFE